MKKNVKFFIAGLIVIVLIAGVYFGVNGGLFQGKASLNKNITRAEFAKLVANLMTDDIGKCDDPKFPDVKPDDWYYSYVCYLYNKNIWKGDADGFFRPQKSMRRGEAAIVLYEAFWIAKGPGGLATPGWYYYQDVYEDSPLMDAVNGLAPYDMWDIKKGKEENYNNPKKQPKFYPEKNLTVGRAQVWAKNFKKAVELYKEGYKKALQ